jgi:hypothetical protein
VACKSPGVMRGHQIGARLQHTRLRHRQQSRQTRLAVVKPCASATMINTRYSASAGTSRRSVCRSRTSR